MKSYGYCHICGGGPFPLGNLYKHLRTVHKCSPGDIVEVQQGIRRTLYGPGSNCDLCGKLYHSKYSLKKHKQNIHKEVCEPRRPVSSMMPTTSTTNRSLSSKKPRKRVVCPRCDLVCYTYSEFAEHCQEKHRDEADFTIHKETFTSWTLFKSWMSEMERNSPSRLVACSGRRSTRGSIRIYRCRYAYLKNAVPVQKQGKRRQKHCPSYAKVLRRVDGLVEATVCFGHIGHGRDDEPSQSPDDSDVLDMHSDSFSSLCYELGDQEMQDYFALESEEDDEKCEEEEKEEQEKPRAEYGWEKQEERSSYDEERQSQKYKERRDGGEEHEETRRERHEEGGEKLQDCKSEEIFKEGKSEEKYGRSTCKSESLAESPNLFYMW